MSLEGGSDGIHFRRPVLQLDARGFETSKVGPVVWQRFDNAVYLAALPLVERAPPSSSWDGDPLITAVLCLLVELAARIVLPPSYYNQSAQLAGLQLYLNGALPFGSPLETDAARVRLLTERGFQSASSALESVRPSWKPYLFGAQRSAQRLELTLTEYIDCAQYDRASAADAVRGWGVLHCRALVNGLCELTVRMGLSGDASLAVLDLGSWALHWCAQRASQQELENELKIACTPPVEPFTLAEYRMKPLFVGLPISGVYQMKVLSKTQLQVHVQLQLHPSMGHHQLDFCVVQIPFHNRGEIVATDGAPTAGACSIDPRRRNVLRWNVGDRFPVRQNLEVAFRALVTVDDTKPVRSPEAYDPFLSGSNAYCQLLFKIADASLSGLEVNPRAVTLSSTATAAAKIPVVLRRAVVARQYIIWNSTGDVRRCVGLSTIDVTNSRS